ncbi:hypothetical protein [Mucilaginibacter sp. KACC 22063]|uniref:hypothetical protein n=1 Tax=Mucilaginibacter sp. KACC 22063 TaxID=3025666 RepID=UPI0023660DBF|nr:hypothetical protein [Mucilaginibacter sp. KACC 22063]WDF53565.1 hypothetical protein PQ461_11480 [Mucilaginibacter sp. KACC 22063]
MKKTLLLVFSICLLLSCKKDDISNKDKFERSEEKFLDFKKMTGNSYTYIVTSGSVFGPSSETVVAVLDGKVLNRHYKAYEMNSQHQNVLFGEWDENAADIGSHTEGWQAVTLDYIYHKAKTEWLKADKKSNDIYFETDANGLISSCGYVPKGCQDDCFNGVTIKSINVLLKN